jgi:hypothetical protein
MFFFAILARVPLTELCFALSLRAINFGFIGSGAFERRLRILSSRRGRGRAGVTSDCNSCNSPLKRHSSLEIAIVSNHPSRKARNRMVVRVKLMKRIRELTVSPP